MQDVCPIIKMVKPSTKEELLTEINQLEIKADVYSRSDYQRYNEICEKIRGLELKLLDIYNEENVTWLQSQRRSHA